MNSFDNLQPNNELGFNFDDVDDYEFEKESNIGSDMVTIGFIIQRLSIN